MKTVLLRPDVPSQYNESDSRHWFDHEFASLTVEKEEMPKRPPGGASHTRVVCICPIGPYMDVYTQSMLEQSRCAQIRLQIMRHGWSRQEQHRRIRAAIARRPDLIVVVPVDAEASRVAFREIHNAEIPLIAGNMMPEPAAYRYVVSWTGPDVWEESRCLAREFAKLMGYSGSYCLLRHVENTSTYFARTYGFICELTQIAPEIRLLDAASSNLEAKTTQRVTTSWVRRYGDQLKGIVSCDDEVVLPTVVKTVQALTTRDLIIVSNGCTRVGLGLLAEGSVQALTYKPPELDGRLAMEVAIDWLNGLEVPPAMFLPVHIVTPGEARTLLRENREDPVVPIIQYRDALRSGNLEELHSTLDTMSRSLMELDIVRSEYLSGVMMRLVGVAAEELSTAGIGETEILGAYENVFKLVAMQRTLDSSLSWIRQLSERVFFAIRGERRHMPLGESIIQYVDTHFREPLSLKTISSVFDISPAYAGRVFRKHANAGFNAYLNALRIKEAQKLLLHSSIPASDVAVEVGFTSRNYFYTVFRQITGMSAGEFTSPRKKNGTPGPIREAHP